MKILFATDGSDYAEWVAAFLTRFNWSPEDSITVFHAIFWMPFGYDQASYLNAIREIKSEIAPRILDSALDILKPVQAARSVALEDGAPEQSIINAALGLNVDMVVIGGKGTGAIESIFLGRIANSIAINSPKPVLVVKQKRYATSGAMKVLFATDGSEHALATEDILSSVPFAGDTEMTVLNVTRSAFTDIPERLIKGRDQLEKLMVDMRSRDISESEKIILEAARRLTKRFKNIRVLSVTGDPSSEILRTAEKTEADIIALGCRGVRGIKGILGSVSRNILTHSKCSVLIGRMC